MEHFELIYEHPETSTVCFRVGDRRYAFNTKTAACFEVDDIGLEALRIGPEAAADALTERFSAEEIAETLAEMEELRQERFLSDDEPTITPPETFGTLELHVSHVCNMACKYCFADQGDYGTGRSLMTEETARRALDFFFAQLGGRTSCTVVFFGGEPLCNMPVIKAATLYAEQLAEAAGVTVAFTTTTNATLLDADARAFVNEHSIGVLVSIDGPQQVQDSLRPLKGGRPSYERMADNIRALSDSRGGRLSARVTVCNENIEIRAYADHFQEMGFDRVYCSVVSCDEACAGLSLTDAQRQALVEEYRLAAADILESAREQGPRPLLLSLFEDTMRAVHGAAANPRACGSGLGMLAVTPEGTLYPCHRFIGREAWMVGDLESGVDPAARERLRAVSIMDLEACRACWCRNICGGRCLNSLARDDGTIGAPNEDECDSHREFIAIALALYVQIQALGEGESDVAPCLASQQA